MRRRRPRGGKTWRPRAWSAPHGEAARSASGSPPGQEFERKVADRLRGLGWDAALTPGSGDRGVDVICHCGSTMLVVQCKDWAKPVGFSAVQEIHTARDLRKASLAAVIVAGSFTAAAREAASEINVLLYAFHELKPGCQLDRSAEGERIRAERQARREAAAAEQAHRQALRDAEERRAEARAIAEAWARHDDALAAHERRLATRGDKLGYLGIGGVLGAIVLVWLGQTHPGWAIFAGGVAAVAGWNVVGALFSGSPPRPPAQPRPSSPPDAQAAPSRATDTAPGIERRVAPCIHCGQLLHLPRRMSGVAKCPSCQRSAWYET